MAARAREFELRQQQEAERNRQLAEQLQRQQETERKQLAEQMQRQQEACCLAACSVARVCLVVVFYSAGSYSTRTLPQASSTD